MSINAKILLVGAGSMGSSILKGWIKAGIGAREYTVITPHERSVEELRENATIHWYEKVEDLPADYTPTVIVFAVKPQIIDKILRSYFGYALHKTVFVTVAAGKPLSSYRRLLGKDASVIRIMPNLPVAYGKGMTVGFADESVPDHDIKLINNLFSSLGKMAWVDREDLFHAATAVSGCGPAYLYALVRALVLAGIQEGLDEATAQTMARQTVIGATELLEHSEESAEVLIQKVASPGGVTEAALTVIQNEENGLDQLMKQAIATGVSRSKELSND